LERDPNAVLRDIRNELLSAAKAEADYGVIIDTQTWAVNMSATAERRADIRSRRGWGEVPKVQWTDPVLSERQ
jgi:N-methylhydantoinase B